MQEHLRFSRPIEGQQHPLAGKAILQVLPRLNAGGVERTTLDIAQGLSDVGAQPYVMSEGGRLVPELQARGGIFLEAPVASKNPLTILRNAARIAALVAEHNIDIIHARSRAPAWSALMAARARGIPFVTTYHGAYAANHALKSAYNSVMARGDAVIANSLYTAGLITTEHRMATGKIRVIPRGVDLKTFAPDAVTTGRTEALRKEWGIKPSQRIILLAGRVTPWKGHRVVVDAAAKLTQDSSFNNVCFVFAGDAQGSGQFAKELAEQIHERQMAPFIRLVGHCADMPAAFMAADVALMPSVLPEAFGRVAVEAQALGCPVIVADHGAVPETVLAPPDCLAEKRTGWRCPPGDADALAEALRAALNLSPATRTALADRSRAHVENQFSLELMVSRTLDVYSALLGS